MKQNSYVVFWLEAGKPMAVEATDINKMLTLAEEQRARKRAGEPIAHVTTSSDDANSVGESGVDVVKSDYNWKKRRP